MHCCTMVCSQVVLIASGSPFNPSHTAIITSTMPRFFTSEKICSQNRAPSAPSPAQIPVDVAFPVHRDTHDNVERGVTDLTVADLHVRIAPGEDHRVDRIQRLDHSASSPTIFSVIRLMVSFDTLAPYTSSKWAATSPVVSPRAVNDNTI